MSYPTSFTNIRKNLQHLDVHVKIIPNKFRNHSAIHVHSSSNKVTIYALPKHNTIAIFVPRHMLIPSDFVTNVQETYPKANIMLV